MHEQAARPWGARFTWALGSLATLVALVVPWVEGCFSAGHGERCGTYIGLSLLGWLSPIPVFLVSVPIAMLFLSPPHADPGSPERDLRRWKLLRLAGWISSGGVVLFAGLMYSGHPWAKTPPGEQPAGWTFKYGPAVMLIGGVVLLIATALYVATENPIDAVAPVGADGPDSIERREV